MRIRGGNHWVATLATVLAVAGGARAGDDIPDLVRLKDGGMARGLIIELVKDDYVVIQVPGGEKRRFAMSEVAYAGPRDQESQGKPEKVVLDEEPTPEPPPVREAPEAPARRDEPRAVARVRSTHSPVSLSAAQSGVTFHVRTGTAQATVSGWGAHGA